jgi:hypothetical protein
MGLPSLIAAPLRGELERQLTWYNRSFSECMLYSFAIDIANLTKVYVEFGTFV